MRFMEKSLPTCEETNGLEGTEDRRSRRRHGNQHVRLRPAQVRTLFEFSAFEITRSKPAGDFFVSLFVAAVRRFRDAGHRGAGGRHSSRRCGTAALFGKEGRSRIESAAAGFCLTSLNCAVRQEIATSHLCVRRMAARMRGQLKPFSRVDAAFARRSMARFVCCAAYSFIDTSLLCRITGCDYLAVAFAEPVSSSPSISPARPALNSGEVAAQYKSHAQMGQTTGRIDG